MKNKETIVNALILMAITLVSGFLLGFMNDLTSEPIEKNRNEQILMANKAVFPSADSFEETESINKAVANSAEFIAKSDINVGKVTINEVKEARDAYGEKLGYLVTVTSHEGYGGDITIVLGIDNDGKVLGIEFTTLDETVGFGASASEPWFKNQFAGKEGQIAYTKGEPAADNEIKAISGATKTTKAVTNAVNAAIFFVNAVLK